MERHYLHGHKSMDATFSPYGSLDSLVSMPRSNSMLKTVRVAVNEPTVSIVQVPRSQPIPIIKTKCKSNQEDELVAYYDLMTWNMYARIVTARRLRASIQTRDHIYQANDPERDYMYEADDHEQLLKCRDVKSMTDKRSQWRKTAARHSSST